MAKHYRIKEFSKRTGVTVRTLHYYDEIKLLKPSNKSVSGHRLYSESDMLRLQQITTLKFLGFSLEAVKQIIQHPNFDIQASLKSQAKVLAKEADKIKNAAKLLQLVIDQLTRFGTVNWQNIAKIIEILQIQDITVENWINKYFSQEELDEFKIRLTKYSPQQQKKYRDQWAKLFAEVKKKMEASPASAVGQKLAKKWLELVDEVYGDYPKIRQRMWEAMRAGAIPSGMMPYYDQDVVDYIDKATKIYKRKNTQ